MRAEAERHPYPLLFATISGAHLYGFPSQDSDYDLRGVHILPAKEAVGLLPKQETVEFAGVRGELDMDLVTHDVRKFFNLLLKRNGYVLEQLYSPLIVQTSPEHDELNRTATFSYCAITSTLVGILPFSQPGLPTPCLSASRLRQSSRSRRLRQ